MADVAGLLAEFQKGIEGKDTGLGATVKFDFEGVGIFLDGKSNPNTVHLKTKMLIALYPCSKHLNK